MVGERDARVLIVDDDVNLRRILRLIFEDAGYTVLEAADGLAALACLRSDAGPLVVLLDWWLPKLDGLGVLRALGVDAPGTPRPRHAYILMTAAYETLDAQFAHVSSFAIAVLLPKPFNLHELLDAFAVAVRELHSCERDGAVAGGDDGRPTDRGANL